MAEQNHQTIAQLHHANMITIKSLLKKLQTQQSKENQIKIIITKFFYIFGTKIFSLHFIFRTFVLLQKFFLIRCQVCVCVDKSKIFC